MVSSFSLKRYPASDIRLARRRCKTVVGASISKLPTLAPTCVLSIVVPAYDENVSRIKEQIAAFNRQTLDPEFFELIYVVNNPSRKTTPAGVLKNNDAVLAFLKKAKSKVPLIIVDRSSRGKELAVGNVGHARNEGIHLAAARYLDQSRDGILFQTDADTVPTKPNLLASMVKEYAKTGAVGAAGGVRFVLSLDSAKKSDRLFFTKHLQAFNQYSQWGYLIRALHAKDLSLAVWPTRLSGANMSSLAIASVCAEGVPTLPQAVDVLFGTRMDAYAKKRGFTILPRRDQWIMRTSFRESKRTGSGFGKSFDAMRRSNGKPLVPSMEDRNVFIPLKASDYKKLKALVYKDPKRRAYAQNAIKYFATFHLK